MKLDRLRFFVMLAQERRFGRAAKRLDITQPTLSHQFRCLEREIGARLVNRGRGGHRFEPSPAGRQLLLDARRLLQQGERARTRALEAAAGETGHLSIGHAPDYPSGMLPTLVARFQSTHPRVLSNPGRVLERAARRTSRRRSRYRFVTRPVACPVAGLRERLLPPTGFVVVLPVTHQRARARSVRLETLAGESFVSRRPDLDRLSLSRCASFHAGAIRTGTRPHR